MKFFLKKTSRDSLQSLNEEEIQKKLYGTFHKNTSTQNNAVIYNTAKNVPFTRPKINKPVFNPAPVLKSIIAKVIKTLQLFPWKFSILVIGFIILFVYSFQFLSGAIHNLSKPKESEHQSANPPLVSGKTAEKSKIKTNLTSIAQDKENRQPQQEPSNQVQNTKLPDTAKKSFYAVQICTYQKESDAKSLSQELKNSNFSAFYLKMQGSQNKNPYFVVFLGKDESYAGANQELKQFRNSEQYQRFPDAFIRSI